MRRVLPFLIALTVLVPSLGHATTLYRCGAGAVSDHCCCAPAAHARQTDRSAVRKGCCCETIRIGAAPRLDRESPATSAPPIAPAIAVAATERVFARPTLVARPRDAAAPPDPLFVLHCALLR